MYKLQDKPEPFLNNNGEEVIPIATLKDEYGGVSHIVEDDHCYVLYNGSANRPFQKVYHWYPEAVEAMKKLPTPQYP
jgi:hypothetical protein